MISKVLLTLSVIIGCFWVLSVRGSQVRKLPGREYLKRQQLFRQLAWSFVLIMVLAASVITALELWSEQATVRVSVINTQSGERMLYQAHRKDIQNRSLITITGREILIADIERIEIEAPVE